MKLRRLNYDKVHRCPGWDGPAFKGPRKGDDCPSGSFAGVGGFYYREDCSERSKWERELRFIKCEKCGIVCLPYITRWLDYTYLLWKVRKKIINAWYEFACRFR